MKVLLISPFPPPYGGIANWSKLIKNKCDVSGIPFEIINIAPKSRVTEGRGLYDRVVRSGLSMLLIRRELKKKLKSDDISVIHMTTSGRLALIRDVLLIKLAKKFNVPVIYHIHFGRVPEMANNNTKEWNLMKKAIGLSSKVIAIDKGTQETINEIFYNKAVYLPNPIDKSNLPLTNKTEKKVVFLGWCVPNKGVTELVKAWNSVGKEFSDYTLEIIGPYKEEYKRELLLCTQVENIAFLGERPHDEAMNLLSRAEVFILPSYTEGFPNVILEAMCLKKAIIATKVGAIPDILSGGCGVLIEKQDVIAIEKALKELLNNESKRLELAENAYLKAISNYDIDVIFGELEKIWKE